jgi:pilus assembly protein Flp/PilA
MKNLMKKFLNDESGATMVEYAVLVALISIAAIATIVLVGNEVNNAFDRVKEELVKANTP